MRRMTLLRVGVAVGVAVLHKLQRQHGPFHPGWVHCSPPALLQSELDVELRPHSVKHSRLQLLPQSLWHVWPSDALGEKGGRQKGC